MSKCPTCGDSAYIGLQIVECANARCSHHVPSMTRAMTASAPKAPADLSRLLDEIVGFSERARG